MRPAGPQLGAALLWRCGAAAAAGAWDEVDIEPPPDGLDSSVNIALLAASCGAVAAVLIAVLVQIVCTGSARLPVLMMTTILFASFASGICAWAVTYTAARDAINTSTTRLIVFAGLSAASRTIGDLSAGYQVLVTTASAVMQGGLDLNAGYPSLHNYLYSIESQLKEQAESINAIYIGLESGALHGVQRIFTKDRDLDNSSVFLWVGVPPSHCTDPSAYGSPQSACLRRVTELYCANNSAVWETCMHPACAGQGGQCEFCLTELGEVPSERCPACRKCDSWLGPVDEVYVVPRDPDEWDLPPTAGQQGGFCFTTSGDEWQQADWQDSARTIQGRTKDGRPGRQWVGGYSKHGSGGCSNYYDPRVRDWYQRKDRVIWSDVYEFVANAGEVEMGISPAIAIRNPEYSGAPYTTGTPASLRDTPWLGVMAIDFTFRSISFFLRKMIPSENSVVLISDIHGTLCAGSLPLGELVLNSTRPTGEVVYTSPNVLDWDHPRLRGVYPLIARRFGSLLRAMRSKVILQQGEASVLSNPLLVSGGLEWLMALYVPHADITQAAEDATTRALALAVGVSLGCGLLTSLLVHLMLRPMRNLASSMGRVAQMDLEISPSDIKPGIAAEVGSMLRSFRKMVESLREYREFLPQSVLVELYVEEVDSHGTGESPSPRQSSPQTECKPSSISGSSELMQRRLSVGTAPSQGRETSTSSIGQDGERQRSLQPGSRMAAPERVTSMVLVQRRVSLVAANMCQWQATTTSEEGGTISQVHQQYVGHCVELILEHRGVADCFWGDKVFASFNSARVNPQHGAQAARCAFTMATDRTFQDTCEAEALPVLKVTAGAASGLAWCGNMGVSGVKRYSVTGGVPYMMQVCERLAARWTLPLIVDGAIRQEVALFFSARVVILVVAPKRGSHRECLLWEVLQHRKAREDVEWMYRYDQRDALERFNEAGAALLRGQRGLAARICREHPEAAGIPDIIVAMSRLKTPEPRPHNPRPELSAGRLAESGDAIEIALSPQPSPNASMPFCWHYEDVGGGIPEHPPLCCTPPPTGGTTEQSLRADENGCGEDSAHTMPSPAVVLADINEECEH
eukprot:TRINITY_DN3555_c0_g1_i1.p1 TRINITY_DN3555_c0_g1~~TRINITY_DN3555_c0_g1_i1.p1  ORF type:complete len:1114 (+),score=338.30 TRINITY_DN3555_c0_g1_i1:88-3342(+)